MTYLNLKNFFALCLIAGLIVLWKMNKSVSRKQSGLVTEKVDAPKKKTTDTAKQSGHKVTAYKTTPGELSKSKREALFGKRQSSLEVEITDGMEGLKTKEIVIEEKNLIVNLLVNLNPSYDSAKSLLGVKASPDHVLFMAMALYLQNGFKQPFPIKALQTRELLIVFEAKQDNLELKLARYVLPVRNIKNASLFFSGQKETKLKELDLGALDLLLNRFGQVQILRYSKP